MYTISYGYRLRHPKQNINKADFEMYFQNAVESSRISSRNIKKYQKIHQYSLCQQIKRWSSLVAQTAKESACNAGYPVSIHGSGRPPGEGNGNPLQYSCLENPMDGQGSPACCSPWGRKEWNMTERPPDQEKNPYDNHVNC